MIWIVHSHSWVFCFSMCSQAAPVLYPSSFVQTLLNVWMKSSKSFLLQNRTVKELLWGYEDPFLKKIPFPIDKKVGIFLPVGVIYLFK